jgi:surfeit locus 1 family protein
VFRALTSPRMIALHLLAIVVVIGTVLLGIWQYDAWQSHRERQASSLANATPEPLDAVLAADAPFPAAAVGQPVRFSGQWLPRSTLQVAGRSLDGRSGRWVVTPVAVCAPAAACDSASAMLVVRGFTASPNRTPPAPTGRVDVTGWLQPGEGSGLTDPDPTDDVLPEMRIADAIQHVDQDLYGGYVVAETLSPGAGGASASRGLEPVTPDSLPEPQTFTALRNLLYAIEWWVFGGFFLFVWWRWCRDEVSRVSAATEAGRYDDRAEVASGS